MLKGDGYCTAIQFAAIFDCCSKPAAVFQQAADTLKRTQNVLEPEADFAAEAADELAPAVMESWRWPQFFQHGLGFNRRVCAVIRINDVAQSAACDRDFSFFDKDLRHVEIAFGQLLSLRDGQFQDFHFLGAGCFRF